MYVVVQKQLEKERAEKQWALTTPRGTTVVQKPESPANDPATCVSNSFSHKISVMQPYASLIPMLNLEPSSVVIFLSEAKCTTV